MDTARDDQKNAADRSSKGPGIPKIKGFQDEVQEALLKNEGNDDDTFRPSTLWQLKSQSCLLQYEDVSS